MATRGGVCIHAAGSPLQHSHLHALNARLKLKQMGATCTPGPAAVSVCALAGTHRRKPVSHFLVKLIAEMH